MPKAEFAALPVLPPDQSLKAIARSKISSARKKLLTLLVTQARSFVYRPDPPGQALMILDVTRFLNHRVNTNLMIQLGKDLKRLLKPIHPDLLLTAPSSGIIPAWCAATAVGPAKSKPDIVYAHKGIPITFAPDDILTVPGRSYTKGNSFELVVARYCLPPGSRVVICDDFLDTGRTFSDLAMIVREAGAGVAAAVFMIEKPYGGRILVRQSGLADDRIISLVKIEAMEETRLKIAGFSAWFSLTRH